MTEKRLPRVPLLETIKKRLPIIFPEGTSHRNYVVREMAAKTIFVMFYAGAIEGTDRWIRPDQVTKMTNNQAGKTSDQERLEWADESTSPGKMKSISGRWYSVNTREPIRDETIRVGLISTGAVQEREGLPTTSSKPRYALGADFAELFNEKSDATQLESKISAWQQNHLSAGALARIRLVQRRAGALGQDVLIKLPNRETRRMAPGQSSLLSKDVIENFAPRFLDEPAVICLSESRTKVVAQDDELASSIGLTIQPDRNLPDVILADLGPDKPLFVFVEVVVTDGAVTKSRKDSLLKIATDGGFDPNRVAFVSAFEDRGTSVFRRLSSDLAWGSFVWFASEPKSVVSLKDEATLEGRKLADLL